MKELFRPILKLIGLALGGYFITRVVQVIVGSSLFLLIAGLIAVKMITSTFTTAIKSTELIETKKIQSEYVERQEQREFEYKIKAVDFDEKLHRKIEIDKEISDAKTERDLIKVQVKAEKDQMNDQVRQCEAKLEQLKSLHKRYLEELPKLIINIETKSGTCSNVMWIGNGITGVSYKYIGKVVGGGVIPYENLSPSSVFLLGLSDSIDDRIANANAIEAKRKMEKIMADQVASYAAANKQYIAYQRRYQIQKSYDDYNSRWARIYGTRTIIR